MDFTNIGSGIFYLEASLRVGTVHNEYKGGAVWDAMGQSAHYETSSAYYGLHLGGGYVWNISDAASLDLYAKYFWSREEGKSATLSTGDLLYFEDADSHRLRLGGRFSYAANGNLSPYIGAALEYEFAGKAWAMAYGYPIDSPKLQGATGIGEVGLSIKSSPNQLLSQDLGLQGYVGKRKGLTGRVEVKFEF
jgi:outer membrane autotransporter protein